MKILVNRKCILSSEETGGQEIEETDRPVTDSSQATRMSRQRSRHRKVTISSNFPAFGIFQISNCPVFGCNVPYGGRWLLMM